MQGSEWTGSFGSGLEPMADSCECSNGSSGSVNSGEFLGQLSEFQLL